MADTSPLSERVVDNVLHLVQMDLFYYSTRAQHHLRHAGSSLALMTLPFKCCIAKQGNSNFPLMVAIDERLDLLIVDMKKMRGLQGEWSLSLCVSGGKTNTRTRLTARNVTHLLRLFGNQPVSTILMLDNDPLEAPQSRIIEG